MQIEPWILFVSMVQALLFDAALIYAFVVLV